jgi:hypothetical protein
LIARLDVGLRIGIVALFKRPRILDPRTHEEQQRLLDQREKAGAVCVSLVETAPRGIENKRLARSREVGARGSLRDISAQHDATH